MNCPKCGAENINGSTFCIKCGTNLKELQSINDAPINEQVEAQNQPIQQPTNQVSIVSLNYFMYFIAILLKPFQCFREEEAKLNHAKTSVLLTLIVSGIMTLANMVKTIFTTVRVASYTLTNGYTYSWQWNNLKNIKWLELIGKNFLIYAGIILAIAFVFYLGSLIVKKNLSFIKSLSIAATSVIPAVIGIMILAPLSGMIWKTFSVVFTVAGAVYTLIILYELMNNELKLEEDEKIYFNLICFGLLAVAGYYAYMKLLISPVNSGLENILDMLK